MQNNLRDRETKTSENKSPWAVPAVVGGLALFGLGVAGLLGEEAKSKEDAIMSVYFGEDHTYYMVEEEIPYAVAGFAGLVITSLGTISQLIDKRREDE